MLRRHSACHGTIRYMKAAEKGTAGQSILCLQILRIYESFKGGRMVIAIGITAFNLYIRAGDI